METGVVEKGESAEEAGEGCDDIDDDKAITTGSQGAVAVRIVRRGPISSHAPEAVAAW